MPRDGLLGSNILNGTNELAVMKVVHESQSGKYGENPEVSAIYHQKMQILTGLTRAFNLWKVQNLGPVQKTFTTELGNIEPCDIAKNGIS